RRHTDVPAQPGPFCLADDHRQRRRTAVKVGKMREGKREITEAELLAYADGKSDSAQATRIADWLAQHPAREAEVSIWQRQNDALRALFGTVANEVVPERLRPRTIAARQAVGGGFRLPQLAAAMLLLALGGGLGWGSRLYVERLTPAS